MDRSIYTRMDAQEAEHWWFRARREILNSLIARQIHLPEAPRILEAGCGTGGNLAMLMRHGRVDAFEFDTEARALAEAKSGLPIPFGALPDNIPQTGAAYDLIGLFDVLEHVEDDIGSLRSLGDQLADDGRLLVTVPAFQALWSKHDERHHHFRRYSKKSLRSAANEAGLEVVDCGYFNCFLLPLAMALRASKAVLRKDAPDDTLPGPAMNAVLHSVFAFERHMLGRISFPAGLSVMAILKQRAGQT